MNAFPRFSSCGYFGQNCIIQDWISEMLVWVEKFYKHVVYAEFETDLEPDLHVWYVLQKDRKGTHILYD